MRTSENLVTGNVRLNEAFPGSLATASGEWLAGRLQPQQALPKRRSVGCIVIQPSQEERRTPAKYTYTVKPFATREGLWLEADWEDVGYPGVTAATLADWPRLWHHPETAFALQIISTLIVGVGRSRFTKADCLESLYTLVSGSALPARKKFEDLAERWRHETAHLSDSTEMALHPAYQEIIGMGPFALPFISEELMRAPDHWFHALKAITGLDPVPEEDRGRVELMRDHWLECARENGFLS